VVALARRLTRILYALWRDASVYEPARVGAAAWGSRAAARGMLVRAPDGRWDALAALDRWRRYVNPLLQRRSPVFRPWLDPQVPLVPSVWDEFVRRADACGAEWERR
jgi:hypothetical protein